MSYYYNYYIGYKTPDNKIYPIGPFDAKGNIHSALTRSRSFASNLHDEFYYINEKSITNELIDALGYAWEGEEKKFEHGKFLPLSELPNGSFIKDGYFLIEDVMHYNETGEADFYDCIPKEVYAAKLQNEITLGPPLPETDEFDQNVTPKSCRDYMYFAYPDTESKEYEACVIRLAAEVFEFAIPKDATMVIIETEG